MDQSLITILKQKSEALYTVPPAATVTEAVKIMADGQVGAVLVMEQGHLRGLFTERDLMMRVVNAGLDPAATPIRDVMTTDIATVSPKLTVGEAMTLCTRKRMRHLPVFDGDTLLGVVSAGDLTKAAVDGQQHTIDDLYRYIYGEKG